MFGSECWLIERMAERNACAIKQLCNFLRLGIKHGESCLRRACYGSYDWCLMVNMLHLSVFFFLKLYFVPEICL